MMNFILIEKKYFLFSLSIQKIVCQRLWCGVSRYFSGIFVPMDDFFFKIFYLAFRSVKTVPVPTGKTVSLKSNKIFQLFQKLKFRHIFLVLIISGKLNGKSHFDFFACSEMIPPRRDISLASLENKKQLRWKVVFALL
jgi:hypothetical protein